MSLYTPVFPPLHELYSSQKDSLENGSVAPLGKQNYVKHLRDLHLFLSTQSDVLSPPSRPCSPMFDRRAQKVKDKVQDIFNTAGETSSANWTRASQTLKLGCVRGRPWSASQVDPSPPEHNTDWILPDDESEWIAWEKKRMVNRCLKGKTNTSQQIGNPIPIPSDSPKPSHASIAGPSQSIPTASYRRPPGVSPTILRAAKEKVKKWQASLSSGTGDDTARASSLLSTREVASEAEEKREVVKPRRSRTLDFAVVKPTVKLYAGKRRKGSLSFPPSQDESTPIPPRKSKTPKPQQTPNESLDGAAVDVDKVVAKEGDMPKISNVPETPFLPPSFPTHLQTSTPLSNSKILVRSKPPPILPASSSTPPPSTPANPLRDQPVPAEPQVIDVSSPLPPETSTAEAGKRPRVSSRPAECADLPVTPPAKRLRTLSPSGSTSYLKPVSPSGALNAAPCSGDDAQDANPGTALPHRCPVDSLEMTSGVPVTPDQPIADVDARSLPERLPSPAKSVKSYFSTPDSDPADSPVNTNLLLESPVSPMLSYAQNPSVFLPQVTSTQARKGSPTTARTNDGTFGMGFSSQFDVERHVDRVSELLEKDVDFDGWVRDARTIEMTHD